MREEGANQDFKIPYFSLRMISKNIIDEDLKKLQILSKAKLIINSNTSIQSACLITESKIHWYSNGKVGSAQFNFTNFEDQYLSKTIVYDNYVIIPDDSTGIQIFKYIEQGVNQLNNELQSYLIINISQFFGVLEWQQIQDMISKQQDNPGGLDDGSGSEDGENEFEFNFSIKSIQIKVVQSMTLNIFTYEQFSKSVCVFTVDLQNKHAKLNQKISTNGKITNFILNNNFLYAHQISSKGIRDSFSLVEFQQKTSSVDYLPRQTYPITSQITKIVVSDALIYSLQENIISIIRRQVPFKLNNEEESKQQISIQYSEGADNFWNFPVTFKSSPSTLRKNNLPSSQSQNKTDAKEDTENNSGSYFSPFISIQDSDSLLSNVDAILVKNEDFLSIRIIQEHLPHLSCTPEEDKDLKQEYEFFVSLEVFDSKDSSGNIKLQTYVEGLAISVYREIFENSTVALVVGLSIGLTLSLIVVIIFCIYFYRMKNHYQLLLQDTSKDLSKEVAVSSINTSSNNSSSESYQSTIPTSSNQNQDDLNNPTHLFNPNPITQTNNSNHRNHNEVFISTNQLQNQVSGENNGFFDSQNGNNHYEHQVNTQNLNSHEFYLNGYQNQHNNNMQRIPNNSRMQDLPQSELSRIRNPEQDISQKISVGYLEENNQNNIINNSNNSNNCDSSDSSKNKQKSLNNIAINTEQAMDDEFESNNSHKSERISFRNNSLEEQESISNSDKSSKGPCAQSQSSKETMGLELISFKSKASDILNHNQNSQIISSPLSQNKNFQKAIQIEANQITN